MSLNSPGGQWARIRFSAWDLDMSHEVLAESVTVTHGREGWAGGYAAPSTCRFVVVVPRGAARHWLAVGSPVTADTGGPGRWARRFTGMVTDITYTWEEHPVTGWHMRYQVQAVGNTTRLGSRVLTNTGWATEPVSARVAYIMAAAGQAYRRQAGDYDPMLTPVTDDTRDRSVSALNELTTLAQWGEAVLWDDTNGDIVWQEIAARHGRQPVDLPAAAVAFAPGYEAHLDLVNSCTLEHGTGTPRQVYIAEDTRSAFYNGWWAEHYATPYAALPGATIKAERVIRRQAWPVVLAPSVTILPNRLTETEWAAVEALRIGDRVRMPAMPDPYPPDVPGQYAGEWIVEGWQETPGGRDTPDDTWRIVLHLSPPVWSIVSRSWTDTPGVWSDYPDTDWNEIGQSA